MTCRHCATETQRHHNARICLACAAFKKVCESTLVPARTCMIPDCENQFTPFDHVAQDSVCSEHTPSFFRGPCHYCLDPHANLISEGAGVCLGCAKDPDPTMRLSIVMFLRRAQQIRLRRAAKTREESECLPDV